jgi:hypothetical protein
MSRSRIGVLSLRSHRKLTRCGAKQSQVTSARDRGTRLVPDVLHALLFSRIDTRVTTSSSRERGTVLDLSIFDEFIKTSLYRPNHLFSQRIKQREGQGGPERTNMTCRVCLRHEYKDANDFTWRIDWTCPLLHQIKARFEFNFSTQVLAATNVSTATMRRHHRQNVTDLERSQNCKGWDQNFDIALVIPRS